MDSGQQQQQQLDATSLPPVVGDPAAASSALASSTEEKPTPTKAGKSCKWNGVTYRPSRDKYQARIYKGNKEYNLGLYDLSCDAALGYDTAHRLVSKVVSARDHEKEMLASLESDTNYWLELSDEEITKSNDELVDPGKVNFPLPEDYKEERSRELDASRDKAHGTSRKHENAPDVPVINAAVRKEAIRVAQIVIGVAEGGSKNQRRKRRNRAGGGKKSGEKRRKELLPTAFIVPPNTAASVHQLAAHNAAMMQHQNSLVASVNAAFAANQQHVPQAPVAWNPGSVLNPTMMRNEHPFGHPPHSFSHSAAVPVGPMAMSNQDMMRYMGTSSTLRGMIEDPAKLTYVMGPDSVGGGDKKHEEAESRGANDNNAPAANDNNSNSVTQGTLQAATGNFTQTQPYPTVAGGMMPMGMGGYYGSTPALIGSQYPGMMMGSGGVAGNPGLAANYAAMQQANMTNLYPLGQSMGGAAHPGVVAMGHQQSGGFYGAAMPTMGHNPAAALQSTAAGFGVQRPDSRSMVQQDIAGDLDALRAGGGTPFGTSVSALRRDQQLQHHSPQQLAAGMYGTHLLGQHQLQDAAAVAAAQGATHQYPGLHNFGQQFSAQQQQGPHSGPNAGASGNNPEIHM